MSRQREEARGRKAAKKAARDRDRALGLKPPPGVSKYAEKNPRPAPTPPCEHQECAEAGGAVCIFFPGRVA